ncbi:MAG: OadG family protein [Bacteroidaceae bacterium]|nr:OadG family protein [Bacteroidaceae bacterium]
MNFLAITIETWTLAGISVAVVFSILVVLVLVLNIFSFVATKAVIKKPSKKKDIKAEYNNAKTLANASLDDKAAVAVALYLYEQDQMEQESGILTITHNDHSWSSQLNTRL